MVVGLSLFALLIALLGVPFGVWLIMNGRLPAWMTGFWTWPLGNNVTTTVARHLGWACLLVGAAALCASALVLLPESIAVFGALIVLGLLGAGMYPLVWGVWLSRTKPA